MTINEDGTIKIGESWVKIIRRLPESPKTLVERPTVEQSRELFDYDPATGVLRWRTRMALAIGRNNLASIFEVKKNGDTLHAVYFMNSNVAWYRNGEQIFYPPQVIVDMLLGLINGV